MKSGSLLRIRHPRLHTGEVVLGNGVVGFEAQSFLKQNCRFDRTAVVAQSNAEVVTWLSKVWLETQGLADVSLGLR